MGRRCVKRALASRCGNPEGRSRTIARIQNARFGNYVAAYANAGLTDLVRIVAVFWSVAVSWKGVRAAFPSIRRRAAAIWFLILPCAFFLAVMRTVSVFSALLAPALHR